MTVQHEALGGRGIDADRILSNLYQGSEPTTGTVVRDAGFDVLILCAMEIQAGSKYPGVTIIKCPLADDPKVGLKTDEWIRAKLAAIRAVTHMRRGARVLSTCHQGLNRSGLVSAWIVHLMTGAPGSQCVARVQKGRPGALYNESFVNALKTRL